jgi:hypothetical protein
MSPNPYLRIGASPLPAASSLSRSLSIQSSQSLSRQHSRTILPSQPDLASVSGSPQHSRTVLPSQLDSASVSGSPSQNSLVRGHEPEISDASGDQDLNFWS